MDYQTEDHWFKSHQDKTENYQRRHLTAIGEYNKSPFKNSEQTLSEIWEASAYQLAQATHPTTMKHSLHISPRFHLQRFLNINC